LKIGVSAAVAGSAISCGRNKGPWHVFTAEEAHTVEAITAQIIPRDQDAGALEAGVVDFIDRQLAGHYAEFQKTYRDGIAKTDQVSLAMASGRFVDLPFDQQTKVLKAIEKKEKEFFSLIVAHTMQGFYGDGRHGGNRDHVSWAMLGVPNPPIRGRRKV
jgi:gluconate 2-dehydrogenase gamma chain